MQRCGGFTVLVWLIFVLPALAAEPTAELIDVQRIWAAAPHCAFTELTRWHDQFVCAFREGRAHVSTDGRIRVLVSPDGKAWQSAAAVTLDGFDLRDAGLSTAPDGRLMLLGGASPRKADGESAPTGTFVAFSEDARTWTKPAIVVDPGRWLWRVTWGPAFAESNPPNTAPKSDGMQAYGIAYSAGSRDRSTSLVASRDGVAFRPFVEKLLDAGYATEATLRFAADDTMYCLQRRDGKAPLNTAMLGVSRPPYTAWQWHDLGVFFGGPNFLELPNGEWIAAGRIVGASGPKTHVASLDVESKKLTPILELPSGGDTSYPGLVWHDDTLWVSFYSSHEGKANIYLARVRVDP